MNPHDLAQLDWDDWQAVAVCACGEILTAAGQEEAREAHARHWGIATARDALAAAKERHPAGRRHLKVVE